MIRAARHLILRHLNWYHHCKSVRYTRLQAKDARYDELHQRHEASVRAHAEELERKDLHHIQVCAQHIVSALSTTVTPSVR